MHERTRRALRAPMVMMVLMSITGDSSWIDLQLIEVGLHSPLERQDEYTVVMLPENNDLYEPSISMCN